jgi:hypothetical protein
MKILNSMLEELDLLSLSLAQSLTNHWFSILLSPGTRFGLSDDPGSPEVDAVDAMQPQEKCTEHWD